MTATENLGPQFKPGQTLEDEPLDKNEKQSKDMLSRIPTWDSDDDLPAF